MKTVHACVVWYAFVCIHVLLILHAKCRFFFEERLFQSKSKQLPGMSFYTIVIYQSLTLTGLKHFTRISKIMARQTRNVSLWAFVC